MSKRIRQYIAIIEAVVSYYIIHEGAHLLYALAVGAFKGINLMTLGVQVDIFREKISDIQLGWFCLAGPTATLMAGWAMVLLAGRICRLKSKVAKACGWYITIIMMVLDPVYLSVLYRFVGGGDMNGIRLLVPETAAAITFAAIGIINIAALIKLVLPKYKESFMASEETVA